MLNDDLDCLIDDFKSKFVKLTALSFHGDDNDHNKSREDKREKRDKDEFYNIKIDEETGSEEYDSNC